jgi:16S rRNA U1498 N3-methylase RsmE
VNLLLVDPEELGNDATCTLGDRRAVHLRNVLGASVGSRIRAGVVGGGLGTAEVLSDDGTAITLRLVVSEPAAKPVPIELVLAIPRPKVLTRVVEIAAAFGVARIDLTNAWRVDKSYLDSPRLAPAALAHAARLGAEQGATTVLPVICVHRRLMGLFEERRQTPANRDPHTFPDEAGGNPPHMIRHDDALRDKEPPGFPEPAGTSQRWPRAPAIKLVAHPGAPPIETAMAGASAPVVLAIGPEGGWITREIDTFVTHGFSPVSLGAPILRVEAAVAAALGQLLVLRRLAPH